MTRRPRPRSSASPADPGPAAGAPPAGYSTAEVGELFGLSPRRVRRFVAAGILHPARDRGAYRFSFQDLVLLRAARDLVTARVPAKRISRVLRQLARQIPEGRALSGLRITADGERVLVRDGGMTWNPESGQVQLDFLVSDLAARVAPLARGRATRALRSGAALPAVDWYHLGYDLEAAAPDDAAAAYTRCLELDPDHPGAHVNLGRLLQARGKLADAERHYRAALEASPAHANAAFNLGTVLEERGRAADAIRAYTAALDADPDHREAHYNLALLHEQRGDHAAALRHLRTCRLLRE